MTEKFIKKLVEKHTNGLPGREHQLKMAVHSRQFVMDAPPEARLAAVMLLIFPKNNEWHVLLTERTVNLTPNRHSGQISFPGGKFESTDASLQACALRETNEEVGIPPETVNVIGAMTDLYIPVSNFHVFPFLGWLKEAPKYQRQETEVQQIIETPLSILQNPRHRGVKNIYIREDFTLEDVPYFDVFGKSVWGATAMMLSEFLEIVNDIAI